MRQIINISLPPKMAKEVQKEVKEEGFASVSEFFRHLLRLHNTYKMYKQIEEGRKEYTEGKTKILKSLKDLR